MIRATRRARSASARWRGYRRTTRTRSSRRCCPTRSSSADTGCRYGPALGAAALDRDLCRHGRALARSRRDLDLALHQPDALAHPEQPEPVGDRIRIEPATVVAHLDVDMGVVIGVDDADPYGARLRVLGDVGERLLHEPIDRGLDLGYVPAVGAALLVCQPYVELDAQPMLLLDPRCKRAQRRLRAERVERRRSHVRDQGPEPGDAVRDHLQCLVDRALQAHRVIAAARSRQEDLQAREVLERLVVQLAGPAPALLLGGPEASAQRLVACRLCRRNRGRRAGGERLQEALVLVGEAALLAESVEGAEEPDRAVPERHRDDERRVCDGIALRDLPYALGAAGAERGPGGGAVDRHPPALDPLDALPRCGGDDQLVAVQQRKLRRARVDQRPRPLHHELEHVVQVGQPSERTADLRRRLEAAVRTLQLVVALAYVAIQARVGDRDRRPVRQHGRGLLVLVREVSRLLLCQVQVPPRLTVYDDRDPEERVHWRVGEREAV